MLRYDPARAADKRTVEVWNLGKRIEIARRLDAYSNCFVKRNKTRDTTEARAVDAVPTGLSMRDLDQAASEIDF